MHLSINTIIVSCYICVQLSWFKDQWNVWCEDRSWEWHFAMLQIWPLCLSSQRPLYGHIFQNNGIMVKSTIATKLMAIVCRSHSTDGCVVTSIFTWGAACYRGHQQDVIYSFGAGFSNVTFHYLPCLVPYCCSVLFFFPPLKYSIISPLWCAFDARVAIQPVADGIQPLQPFVSRFQQADLKMLSPSQVLLMCSHSFLQLTGLYPLQLA